MKLINHSVPNSSAECWPHFCWECKSLNSHCWVVVWQKENALLMPCHICHVRSCFCKPFSLNALRRPHLFNLILYATFVLNQQNLFPLLWHNINAVQQQNGFLLFCWMHEKWPQTASVIVLLVMFNIKISWIFNLHSCNSWAHVSVTCYV